MNGLCPPKILFNRILWFLIPVVYLMAGCFATSDVERNNNSDDFLVSATPHEVMTNNVTLTIAPSPTTLLGQAVSPTPTPIITPTQSTNVEHLGAIYQFFVEAYAWSHVMLVNGKVQVDNWADNALNGYQLPHSPGNSWQVVFSHYTDQIAYWTLTNPGEFWISDVAYEQPHQIFVDTDGTYVESESLVKERIQLRWSPDDKHVVIYTPSEKETHLIYHLETDKIEAWYWLCQDVIVSPQTNQLAVLCLLDARFGADVGEAYAIMEWSGDIWYTSERPERIISQALPDGTIPWHFSADGQLLAYFDPNDPENHLSIADVNGDVRKVLPGSSLLQPDQRVTTFATQYYTALPERNLGFFRWSRDGKQLLAHVLGSSHHPCRLLQSSEESELYESPCWQVVDTTTGKVLWSDVDSEETLFRDEFEKSTMRLVQAEFSPNGEMIAVRGQYFSDQLLAVIDLDTSAAYRLVPLPYAQIYWADSSR